MVDGPVEMLRRENAPGLALKSVIGRGPTLLWLCGFRSDMSGQKATALHEAAQENGRAYLRFDFSGAGLSEGVFEEQTIGSWRQDALDVIDRAIDGPVIAVGSSMGGWIALLAALARPERIAGLVLVAPAPDFTERLMRASLPPEAHAALAHEGVYLRPSAYGDGPTPITAQLLEDGRRWRVLEGAALPIAAPVRILHGQRDPDVPFALSLELAQKLTSEDVEIMLVKRGDHRLSEPADVRRLIRTCFDLQDALR